MSEPIPKKIAKATPAALPMSPQPDAGFGGMTITMAINPINTNAAMKATEAIAMSSKAKHRSLRRAVGAISSREASSMPPILPDEAE